MPALLIIPEHQQTEAPYAPRSEPPAVRNMAILDKNRHQK